MSGEQDAIVAGTDGSEGSLRAVRWAAREAAQRHARLHVVHACAPLVGLYGAGLSALRGASEQIRRAARERLDEAVRVAHDAAGDEVVISSEMPEEAASPLLVERSRRARMMVLGSTGTGGFTGMLVGSTAVQVSAHAACPVVVVRGREAAEGPVVVGVDGSRGGERALATAFEEASRRAEPLVAVRSWNDAEFPGYYGNLYLTVDWDEIEKDEQRTLTEQLAGWAGKYPDVEVERVVVRDRPYRQLLEWSSRAQLLVVGSRGRGGFRGLLLGSTSQALINHADCPVVIVRPGQDQ
ncbi:universal stress protein [Amycolatopsis thermophila]|uniref:Nucleotide-binding universal stress UspA family protein n=1 Tax=Amycolatopsis thermophila TaxID=206084 RepID=A0ABU0F0Y3_9PSEU|nr:universal stress protein [Amycolatopsis thermophila]MDQ0381163.1 nucleotide-binding universal stress UspA family protein [Amycolatopsis thermophila]